MNRGRRPPALSIPLALVFVLVLAFLAGASTGCKNPVSLDLNGPAPTSTTATVTIRSTGFDPNFVWLRPGGTLTFDNRDSVAHQIVSDGCSELNIASIGGGRKVSIHMRAVTMTCGYYDQATPACQGSVQLCSEFEGLLGPCR
jgi:plastocyanin